MKNPSRMYVFHGSRIVRTLLLLFCALIGIVCASVPISIPTSPRLTKALLSRGLLLPCGKDERVQMLLTMALPVFAAYEEPIESTPKKSVESEELPAATLPSNAATYRTTSQKGYTSSEGIYINNQTDKEFDLKALLEKELPFSLTKEPLVLILHSHTSESYAPSEKFKYTPTDTDRTEDINFNVARVGAEVAKKLDAASIPYIHDSAINDYPSYSGSYAKALTSIEGYIEKYPSIKVVIDVHRDSIVRADGTKMKTVCTIDNETSAQAMLVVGTDGSGLSHPNWKDNLSFALKLQYKMNELYPTLARPINLRKQRFNGHTAPGAVIVEVGSDANTLDEALLCASYFSDALIEVLR